MADQPTITSDVEQMIAELKAAGWTEGRYGTMWKSPEGTQHRGPYSAWRTMLARKRCREEGDPHHG
jgi:hypothetical protein